MHHQVTFGSSSSTFSRYPLFEEPEWPGADGDQPPIVHVDSGHHIQAAYRETPGQPPIDGPREVGLFGDVMIRAIGIAAAAVSAAIFLWLRHAVQMAPQHDMTAVQYLCAAGAFLAGSVGAGLTILGHHLFDKIVLSERWRRRA